MKNYLLPTLFCLSLAAPSAFAVPLLCEDVFKTADTPLEVSFEGQHAIKTLTNLPEMLLPIANPKDNTVKWASFDGTKYLKEAMENYAEKIKTMTPDQRRLELSNYLRLIDQDPTAREFFDALAEPQKLDYLPAQYHLRKKLFAEITKALKVLPKEFRTPIGRVPRDKRLARLNQDARKFMKEQNKTFDKLFATTGYDNYAAYEAALRKSTDPHIQKAVELLDNHKLEVIMRRPEAGRFWIPITGIQNQYVSGTSKGYLGTSGRYGGESIMTDREKTDYAKIDDEVKPKYGTLRVADDSGVTNSLSGSSQYGSDIYTFKEEAIQDRVSLFIGDSLNHVGTIGYNMHSGRTAPAASWQVLFIPWSKRLLIVPYMTEALKNNQFGAPSQMASSEMPIQNRNGKWHSYWESQIFGRVTLDMVKTFEFEYTPPSPEFTAELKKHGIKIFDLRVRGERKEWDGN